MLPDLGSWLVQQRQARGWSAAEMARQLQRAGRACGDTTMPGAVALAAYIRRWERGQIGPTERYRLHYCKALAIQPGEFGPGQPGHPPAQPADVAAGDVLAGAVPAVTDLQTDAELPLWPGHPSGYRVRKGHTSTEDAGQWTQADMPPGYLVTVIAEESLDFGEWADTSNVGDATLEHYAAQVRQLAREYVHAAPYPLLLDARRLRDRVFTKLQGHQHPAQTRDLYLIAAQACGMLAWMSGDLGYQRAAQTHAWTAWVCAEQAGHDGARAWVRATQSKLAYWDERHSQAAELAEDGLSYECAGSGRTLLALQMARALARVGREDAARMALSRAETEREGASGEDDVGGMWGLKPAEHHCLEGTTLLWLNDAAGSLAASGRAIQLFEQTPSHERRYGDEIVARIDQCRAHLRAGDLDGADSALRPVFRVTADQRQEPFIRSLQPVREALARPTYRAAPLARELQEEIEAYCRESIVNDLRD